MQPEDCEAVARLIVFGGRAVPSQLTYIKPIHSIFLVHQTIHSQDPFNNNPKHQYTKEPTHRRTNYQSVKTARYQHHPSTKDQALSNHQHGLQACISSLRCRPFHFYLRCPRTRNFTTSERVRLSAIAECRESQSNSPIPRCQCDGPCHQHPRDFVRLQRQLPIRRRLPWT